MQDDGFGVAEPLNEQAFGSGLIARGSIYFVFGSKASDQKSSSIEANERFIQLQTHLPSWPLFSDVSDMSYAIWQNKYIHRVSVTSFSFLDRSSQKKNTIFF